MQLLQLVLDLVWLQVLEGLNLSAQVWHECWLILEGLFGKELIPGHGCKGSSGPGELFLLMYLVMYTKKYGNKSYG